MSVDGRAAWSHLLHTPTPLAHPGACLYYVWLAYHAVGATSKTVYPTAAAAQKAVQHMHAGDRHPPMGVPLWFGVRSVDGNADGDVIIAGPADGQHAATDQPHWSQIGETTIAAREKLTGRPYLGWSEDFLGNRVWTPPAPKPKPKPYKAVYVVRKGDTLFAIAQRFYGNGNLWNKVYNANRKAVGNNPNMLKPGTKLTIPG